MVTPEPPDRSDRAPAVCSLGLIVKSSRRTMTPAGQTAALWEAAMGPPRERESTPATRPGSTAEAAANRSKSEVTSRRVLEGGSEADLFGEELSAGLGEQLASLQRACPAVIGRHERDRLIAAAMAGHPGDGAAACTDTLDLFTALHP